jgi:iron complex transport system permease protein
MQDAVAAVLGAPGEPAHTVVMEAARAARVVRAGHRRPAGGGRDIAAGIVPQPLADSYVLGVSGGSSLGALLALLVGGSLWLVQASAAAGAVLATLLVLALARGGGTVRVLLTGVVLASACGALVTLVLVLADNGQLRGMMFWLAGDLGWARRPWTMAGAALLATAAVSLLARPLDVLATGETDCAEPRPRPRALAHDHRDPRRHAHGRCRDPGRHHRLRRHGRTPPGAAGLPHRGPPTWWSRPRRSRAEPC